jgi:hexokinase
MDLGLDGKPSSLAMIPTYIETSRAVPRGRRVVALDAGGTNLRVATVIFNETGRAVIENLARHRMPGIDEEIDRPEFFRQLAAYVLPLAGRADRVGFCFSYPAEILPSRDGRLIQFTKEVKARGVEGQLLGANLSHALESAGAQAPEKVILLNDTVATLLAGRNAAPQRSFDGFVGIVCGTGFNACYVERNELVRKAAGLDPSGSQIINTESGSFGLTPVGPVDDAFDQTTANPSRYRHEKMISGAYLGGLGLFAAQQAARKGFFSPAARRALDQAGSLSTKELNDFILRPESADNTLGALCQGLPGEDRRGLVRLLDCLVERAALLVAVTIAAPVLKSCRGREPGVPICVTVDGTTFWQLKSFRERVEAGLRSILSGERARAWEIASVEDAPLLGAAIAALTN